MMLHVLCNVVRVVLLFPAMKSLGESLRALRGDRTLRDVADATGYDFTWLSKVENGREVPSWNALKKLLKEYGVCELAEWAYAHLKLTKPEQFRLALQHDA